MTPGGALAEALSWHGWLAAELENAQITGEQLVDLYGALSRGADRALYARAQPRTPQQQCAAEETAVEISWAAGVVAGVLTRRLAG